MNTFAKHSARALMFPFIGALAVIFALGTSSAHAAGAGIVVLNLDGKNSSESLRKYADVVEFSKYAEFQLTGIPTFKLTSSDGKQFTGPLGQRVAVVEYPDTTSDLTVPGEAVHVMQEKLQEMQSVVSVYEKAKPYLTAHITSLSARLKQVKPDDIRYHGIWMSPAEYKALIAKGKADEIAELNTGDAVLKQVKVRGLTGDEISLAHADGTARVKWAQLGWNALRQLAAVSPIVRDHPDVRQWYYQFHEEVAIGGKKYAGARVTSVNGGDFQLKTESGSTFFSLGQLTPAELAQLATKSPEIKQYRDSILDREKATQQAMTDYAEGLRAELLKDWSKARGLYEKAFAAGHAWAGVNLSALLISGQGGAPDETKGQEILVEAAKGGDPIAAYNLALVRFSRLTQGSRDAECVSSLELASSKDIAMADYLLGIMYANGSGVSKDLQRSQKHLSLAKSRGVIEATDALRVVEERMRSGSR